MSVYIKGMKMPTSCASCRFSGFGGLRNERVVCMFTGANAYMNEVQYLDDCPLVPVPEHGDLIDLNAPFEAQYYDEMTEEWSEKTVTVGAVLYGCMVSEMPPVIIQADKEEQT